MPCLTASRTSGRDWWVTPRGGRILAREIFRFQGFGRKQFCLWKKAGISSRQMCKMIGNSMSVNVAERVIGEALWAAGLVTQKPIDRWC
eukprot:1798503-Pyramimonas_sp.AAC.1